MASTYSTNLKIELIGTGEQAGTWGNTTNTNLGTALEQAVVGKADVAMSSTTVTLTLSNSNAAQNARAIYLNLTGSPGGAAVLEVPAIEKPYIVKNGSDQQVTIKVSGQTGVPIPTTKTAIVYNNGTDVVTAIDFIPSLVLGAALPVASGGTGSTSTTFVDLTTNVTGTLPIANGGTGSTSTTFVDLTTNVTGTLPVANGGTGITSFGTGVATFLGTPSSANLAAAVTDETGTGDLVFATSPTLVTPVLGTPTSGQLSNCTVDGTDAVGFRNIPQNSQSAAYTLVLADSGKHIFHPVGDNNARTFTIPANSSVAFPIGTAITFINMAVADVTIAITTDTLTLSDAGTTGSRTLATNGSATCIKITSTEWLISGSGLT
jgi:hypothetical protein